MTTQPTVRYFYTDPIASAWMVKNHGMNICILEPSYRVIKATDDAIFTGRDDFHSMTVLDLCNWVVQDCVDYKFYIHPESQHLLEPKYKDLLVGPNAMAAMFYMDAGDKEPSKKCKIVYRNGVVFHSPESEEGFIWGK